MNKVAQRILPKPLRFEMTSKGWSEQQIDKMNIPKSYKNFKVSENYVTFDNVRRNLVHNNICHSCTDFYNSKGPSIFKMLAFEKEGEKVKKSLFNVFLEHVLPSDGIKNSNYKAIVASEAKKVSYLV